MLKRRARKLIDYEVQSSLVMRLCIHWILFMFATALALFLWIRLFETPVDSWSSTTSKFTSTFIPLMIVALALLPVFILDAVKLSNRFTGPIFRLRRALSNLANGTPVRPLQFRGNDFWRQLADDFNRVVLPKSAAAADDANPSSPNKS